MKIVKIQWTDSSSPTSNWISKDTLSRKPITLESVGFLIEKNEEATVIVQGYDNDFYHKAMIIPNCSIKKITVIKEGK